MNLLPATRFLTATITAAACSAAMAADPVFINGFEAEPPALAGITAAHNVVRAGVGVAPLFWSGQLAASAQAWANRCIDSDGNGLVDHNDGRSDGFPWYVGENIYGSSGTATPQAAVDLWVAEAQYYDHDTNTCASGHTCGHYTQVVWSTSIMVGCGISSCPGLTFGNGIVCDYGPGGNTGGPPY
jgi:pathogenesis-related protein 1